MEHLNLAEQYSRGLSYRREIRNRKISSKKRFVNRAYGYDWYKHDGQYSKGKIHCSCRMCTYSKFYDLPRLKDYKEAEVVKQALEDYYANNSIKETERK